MIVSPPGNAVLADRIVHTCATFSLLTTKRASPRLHTMCLFFKQDFCIDCCRAKFGESAFLEVYQKLYEAPDPATVLISAAVSFQAFSTNFLSHHLNLAQQPMQCWQHNLPTSHKHLDYILMATEQTSAACSTNTGLPILHSMQASTDLFAMPKHTIDCK